MLLYGVNVWCCEYIFAPVPGELPFLGIPWADGTRSASLCSVCVRCGREARAFHCEKLVSPPASSIPVL